MRLLFKLLKEILWNPIWATVLALFALVGNTQTLFGIAEWVTGKDLSNMRDNPVISEFLLFMSRYWIPILLVIIFSAITNGVFQRSRNYLGDRIVANKITLTRKSDEHKGDIDDKYAWIQIDNKEEFDLRKCYAALKTLKIKSGDTWIPWAEIANENNSLLTFPEFKDKEVIVHPDIPVRLNIAKTDGKSIFLIFERGDVPIHVQYVYPKLYVEIVVGGKDYDQNKEIRKIEDKIFRGFLILESGIDDPYEMQEATTDTKVEVKPDTKVTTTTRVERTIKVGHRYWYNLHLEAGELSDEDQQDQAT